MRRLIQPGVFGAAASAALATSLACYPRLTLWAPGLPLFYLEAALFLSALILWSFVFAWHTPYTGLPVFTFCFESKAFLLATGVGLGAAASLAWLIDPTWRALSPASYPHSLKEWTAMALFSLSLTQLFLVFAPFDWLMRLTNNRTVAVSLTMLVGVVVLVLKARSSEVPAPAWMLAVLLCIRVSFGICAVLLYLRGGVVLVWWCGLLVEARHLWSLLADR